MIKDLESATCELLDTKVAKCLAICSSLKFNETFLQNNGDHPVGQTNSYMRACVQACMVQVCDCNVCMCAH